MRPCPTCDAELDEVFYASDADLQDCEADPRRRAQYACPACNQEWCQSEHDGLVLFISPPNP
jgi:hypothetical protein